MFEFGAADRSSQYGYNPKRQITKDSVRVLQSIRIQY